MYICTINYNMETQIKILLLEEAEKFMAKCSHEAAKKIAKTFDLVEAGCINSQHFKKIKGTEIWEFREEYESNAYRLLAFWDKKKRSLIVATHGFIKKTQKTPKKEIDKAEQIRKEYYNNK